MTLNETRMFLTQLWCAFPSAPRLSNEDREATVVVWFSVLKDFCIRDVWFAAEKAIQKNCRFIPSVYEIRKECVAHPDIEMFVTKEYSDLQESMKGYSHYYSDIPFVENRFLICELEHAVDLKRIEEIKSALLLNQNELEKEERLRVLYKEAEEKAMDYYHKTEAARYMEDAMKLGLATRYEALA